jgi:hypothetical protein
MFGLGKYSICRKQTAPQSDEIKVEVTGVVQLEFGRTWDGLTGWTNDGQVISQSFFKVFQYGRNFAGEI